MLWEHDTAGEGVSEIATAFGIPEADVRWALSYEMSTRAS